MQHANKLTPTLTHVDDDTPRVVHKHLPDKPVNCSKASSSSDKSKCTRSCKYRALAFLCHAWQCKVCTATQRVGKKVVFLQQQ